MAKPAIVAIVASQGGVEALMRIVAGLDPAAPAIWCVVLHVDGRRSCLPEILARAGPLPAFHVQDGARLEPGRIHVAPPDHHFVVSGKHARLSRGPRVNWTRPAADPLFSSAAEAFGTRAIGVVLTGNLNDGTAGLHDIRTRGGLGVVQDPSDAMSPGMPRSALERVGADHTATLARMPALLCRLARDLAGSRLPVGTGPPVEG